jgi:antirestriction protein ArdC
MSNRKFPLQLLCLKRPTQCMASAAMVGMPSRNCFESLEAYYSTLFHELTHSTGHTSRLNRFEEAATDHEFGSESYSKEELVAEMGAAMLAGIAGISHATLSNSASYLQTWITRLKSDSRLIISAASHAQIPALTPLYVLLNPA